MNGQLWGYVAKTVVFLDTEYCVTSLWKLIVWNKFWICSGFLFSFLQFLWNQLIHGNVKLWSVMSSLFFGTSWATWLAMGCYQERVEMWGLWLLNWPRACTSKWDIDWRNMLPTSLNMWSETSRTFSIWNSSDGFWGNLQCQKWEKKNCGGITQTMNRSTKYMDSVVIDLVTRIVLKIQSCYKLPLHKKSFNVDTI